MTFKPTAQSPVSPASALPAIPVLAVVGVGLIGGSLASALRQRRAAGRVLGVGRNERSLSRARQLGLIDEVATLEQAALQADLIILATPVGAIENILARIKPHLRAEAVITDVGSTKVNVVAAARAALGNLAGQFVPGHPIAGAEKTGPEAANARLYQGRTVVLTPLAENSAATVRYVTAAWECCGARVIVMEPEAHDIVLASVSHVPHFLSAVFMEQVAASRDSDVRLALAGSGFRDFTRIAAGSPEMWSDIFLANRDAVLSELQEVKAALSLAEQSLRNDDVQGLRDFLERAAAARRFWGARSGLL